MFSLRNFLSRASNYSPDMWLFPWSLSYFSIGAFSLLVPLYAISLGSDSFIVGLLEGTTSLAGVPGAILSGRPADKTGRRHIFIIFSPFCMGFVLLAFLLYQITITIV